MSRSPHRLLLQLSETLPTYDSTEFQAVPVPIDWPCLKLQSRAPRRQPRRTPLTRNSCRLSPLLGARHPPFRRNEGRRTRGSQLGRGAYISRRILVGRWRAPGTLSTAKWRRKGTLRRGFGDLCSTRWKWSVLGRIEGLCCLLVSNLCLV